MQCNCIATPHFIYPLMFRLWLDLFLNLTNYSNICCTWLHRLFLSVGQTFFMISYIDLIALTLNIYWRCDSSVYKETISTQNHSLVKNKVVWWKDATTFLKKLQNFLLFRQSRLCTIDVVDLYLNRKSNDINRFSNQVRGMCSKIITYSTILFGK